MNVSFRNRLLGRGLQLVSTWTKLTARLHVKGLENLQEVRAAGFPALWTSWHGQTMMVIMLHLQKYWRGKINNPDIKVMIPDDWRGESLYAWLKYVNFVPVPMDLENKGMGTARKFANLVRSMKGGGFDNFMAPDGPAGPSFQVKPGAIFLAQKLGVPLLPVGSYTRAAYELNRWDAFSVPLPFSRIEIVVGEPIMVPKKTDTAAAQEQIINALHRATQNAKANYYAARGH